jgi:hypothetical protein
VPVVPPPQASPQPPSPWDGDSSSELTPVRPGEVAKKKKRPSMTQVILLSALAAVTSTGGTIVFLLGYASDVRAQSIEAAKQVAQVQSSQIAVLQSDVASVKANQSALDAGFAETTRRLEQKIDDSNRRNEERYDKIADGQKALLTEIRKR